MATYRLTIEYEGTRYHGWQEQQNARSVAGELKRAVREIAPLVELGGSGRTDAGVHALAQCAHLRVRRPIEPAPFRKDLNDRLPPDIHVLSVLPVGDSFHARHSAVARSYLYQVSRRRTAFAKRYVWWIERPLDAGRIEEAAALLRGRHDFVLFCERPKEQPSTLVDVEAADVACSGALILLRFVASHFLWKMVRRMVGTLVRVGSGEIGIGDFAALLEPGGARARTGKPAEWTAPASGLFLERVLYQGDLRLPPLSPAIPVAAEADASQAPRAPRKRIDRQVRVRRPRER